MHSPHMRHLGEMADGSCHALAIKQNLSLSTQLLALMCRLPILKVTANTTAIPCTKDVHAPAALPGSLS